MKRFSVSLDERDYKQLRQLAKSGPFKMSLQNLVQYAVHRLLSDVSESPQMAAALKDPLGSEMRLVS